MIVNVSRRITPQNDEDDTDSHVANSMRMALLSDFFVPWASKNIVCHVETVQLLLDVINSRRPLEGWEQIADMLLDHGSREWEEHDEFVWRLQRPTYPFPL
jgi:hypothetical protein